MKDKTKIDLGTDRRKDIPEIEAKISEPLGKETNSSENLAKKLKIIIPTAFVLLGIGFAVYNVTLKHKKTEELNPTRPSQVSIKNLPAPIVNSEPDKEVEKLVKEVEEKQKEYDNLLDLQKKKLRESLLYPSTGQQNGGQQQQTNARAADNELTAKLQPMKLEGSKAGQLKDRDFLVTQGTLIDCVLETKLITTQPGMAACHVMNDVYSSNGRVVMIDKGSKVVGFYQGGLQQGQARIFVQWSRLETPEGVVVDLASPGTGPLGEAGLGGYVDNHFFQRFGGAILLSVVGDLGNAASKYASNGSSIELTNTTDGIQNAATEALKNSINIPPTLYKNQGEKIAIFVARDLDFSDVYSLTTN